VKATVTLSQDEIKRALAEYVQRNGMRVSGPVSLHYSPGDQRDPGECTATVTVEAAAANPPVDYMR
jgi:hypothetical protein